MPYFCPSRGLQVRGLIKTSREPKETEYTFNQVRALEYEATSFEHAGSMRHDSRRCWRDERSTSWIQKEDGNFNVR